MTVNWKDSTKMTAFLTAIVGINAAVIFLSRDNINYFLMRKPTNVMLEVKNNKFRTPPNLMSQVCKMLSDVATESLQPGVFKSTTGASVQDIYGWTKSVFSCKKLNQPDMRCYTLELTNDVVASPSTVAKFYWLNPNDIIIYIKRTAIKGLKHQVQDVNFEYMDYIRGSHKLKPILIKRFKGCTAVVIAREVEVRVILGDLGVTPKLVGILPACDVTFNSPALVLQHSSEAIPFETYLASHLHSSCRVQLITLCWSVAFAIHMVHEDHIILNDFHFSHLAIVHYIPKSECNMPKVMIMDLSAATFLHGVRFLAAYDMQIAPEVRTGEFTSFASDIYCFGELLSMIRQRFDLPELKYAIEWCMREKPMMRPTAYNMMEYLNTLREWLQYHMDGHQPPTLEQELSENNTILTRFLDACNTPDNKSCCSSTSKASKTSRASKASKASTASTASKASKTSRMSKTSRASRISKVSRASRASRLSRASTSSAYSCPMNAPESSSNKSNKN